MSAYDWYPANHTYDGSRLVQPHYRTMPDFLRVYDIPVRTSGWARWQKKLWRSVRDKALSRWGIPVRVIEKGLVVGDYPPEGITLDIFEPDPAYGGNNYGGFGLAPISHPETSDYDEATWEAGKGFALIHPKTVSDAFAARVGGYLTGAICHEVGHALGFGHGGTGVMRAALSPPYYPNAEELGALRYYWGWP